MKEGLRYALKDIGALFVTPIGIIMMLKWSVGTARQLGLPFGGIETASSELELDLLKLLMLTVLEMRTLFYNAYMALTTHVHSNYAEVRCQEAECNETDIRLVGGASDTEGCVEVCIGGLWGIIPRTHLMLELFVLN